MVFVRFLRGQTGKRVNTLWRGTAAPRPQWLCVFDSRHVTRRHKLMHYWSINWLTERVIIIIIINGKISVAFSPKTASTRNIQKRRQSKVVLRVSLRSSSSLGYQTVSVELASRITFVKFVCGSLSDAVVGVCSFFSSTPRFFLVSASVDRRHSCMRPEVTTSSRTPMRRRMPTLNLGYTCGQ